PRTSRSPTDRLRGRSATLTSRLSGATDGGPRRRVGVAVPGSGHLAKPAGLHLVDEAADVLLAGDERACLDPCDRLAHVRFEIVECLGRPLRLDAGVLLHLATELVVAERQHPAVAVVD